MGFERLGVVLLIAVAAGCASQPAAPAEKEIVVVRQASGGLEMEPVPGTVNDIWIEPIHDTVRVPGQLDPTGTYYRPSHRTIVEIRPGRFQAVEYPSETREGERAD